MSETEQDQAAAHAAPDVTREAAPEHTRLSAAERRKLLADIAASASGRDLRSLQADVISAYVEMVMRRVHSGDHVAQVREAARARLLSIKPRASTSPK